MSIISKILNKTVGVPEVNLKPILGSQLIEELQKNGVKEVFKALSDDDMKIIDKAVQTELYNRKSKAGIGKCYE